MKFAIAGGDERFRYLAELMKAQGYVPVSVGEADVIVTQNPVRNSRMDLPTILHGMRRDARLYLLGGSRKGIPESVRCTDLLEREDFLTENAELTAEGALHAAMDASDGALHGSRCTVTGFGRIGKALTRDLLAMGARVTVAARREAARKAAEQLGADACGCDAESLKAAAAHADYVFSTVPALLFSEEVLRVVPPETPVIDLASPPYGVDLTAAKRLNRRAWRESGLPGRYCPEAAARAMLREISKLEKLNGKEREAEE